MREKAMMPKVTFQLDLDDSRAVYGAQAQQAGPCSFYAESLRRYLELFDSFGLKATLFVIGQDLEDQDKRDLVKLASQKGHEIANHSWRHLPGFIFLSEEEAAREIETAQGLINKHIGKPAAGFKAPNYNFSPQLLRILRSKGYIYDSSLLPTPLAPFIRAAFGLMSPGLGPKRYYLSKARYGFAWPGPYRHAEKGGLNEGIWEWPVCSLPLLRLPFNASYIFALERAGLGRAYFNFGITVCSISRLDLNFAFHLADLADNSRMPAFMLKNYGFMPLDKRLLLAKRMITKMLSLFTPVRTQDHFKGK